MNRVRIFISSPGDVAEERQRALAVVQNLQEEFSETLALEPLLWEQEPLLATADFQSQIRSPADFDVFATIIGSRLGSPLGSQFTRRDGTPYASGTEFEFEVAVAAHHASGKPELLFYRKPPHPSAADRQQLDKVAAFFDKWFPHGDEKSLIGDYHSFDETGQFEELFTEHLRRVLRRFLPRPNNLPAPISSFVARVDLISEISDLLTQRAARTVQLCGPWGVGKSRLALRTVRGLLPDFDDGVFLVAADGCIGAHAVCNAVVDSLQLGEGVTGIEELATALHTKKMLLVIDNVDGIESVANDINTLSLKCPNLRFIVTCQEELQLENSHTIEVPPLAVPDDAATAFSSIRDSEAVQLFVDRAQTVREDFELTEENAQEISQICRRLGGVPRSIELATSRMRSMNATKLLRSLESIKVKDESGNTVYLVPR